MRFILVPIIGMVLLLTGCGRTGPLYLPENQQHSGTSAKVVVHDDHQNNVD